VSNIVKIVKHEAYFTSEDGKQEYHVKTLEIEGPADSVAQHIARMKENGEVGDWTLDPADPSNSELLKSGAQKDGHRRSRSRRSRRRRSAGKADDHRES
jgi:hypothetical protein